MTRAQGLARAGRCAGRFGRVACVFTVWMAASGIAAAAASTPACDEALKRYDAKFKERSDDAAIEAARALEGPCSGNNVARARAVSQQGVVYFNRHDLAAAAEAFKEAVRLDPENSTLRMSLCGVYSEAERYGEALEACFAGMKLAKAQDDGTAKKHETVLKLGYNLALTKTRLENNVCGDHAIHEMFEAYRKAHPNHGMATQFAGAWAWDCEHDFEKGFALYKKSCALGNQPACEQVEYTKSCKCQDRPDSD
jgi:tetratricopeptide (TPR) repeat protein